MIVDRFDQSTHNAEYSMEDMKEWFYTLTAIVKREQRCDETAYFYDAETERQRKERINNKLAASKEEVSLFCNFCLFMFSYILQIEAADDYVRVMQSLRPLFDEFDKRREELQDIINNTIAVTKQIEDAKIAAEKKKKKGRKRRR